MQKAVDRDRHFLANVCRSVSRLYDPILPGAFAKQAQRFEEIGLPDNYQIFLIYHDDEPIGFVGLTSVTPKIGYLVALYLLSTEQRRGVGSKVLELVCNQLAMDGFSEVVLLVHQEARWAINFYLKNGFVKIGSSEEEIKGYADWQLEKYYLPGTYLLRRDIR